MTLKTVREKLEGMFDTLGTDRTGCFVLRQEFFFTHGNSADKLAARIKAAIPSAVIVETADVWKSFRGGASTANSSHYLVRFKVEE